MLSTALILGELNEIGRLFEVQALPEALGITPYRRFDTFEEAVPVLTQKTADCVILAGFQTTADAGEIIEQIHHIDARIPVIVTSATMSAAEGVRLTRAGAWNCFGPGDSADRMIEAIESAKVERHRRRKLESQSAGAPEAWRSLLVGDSPAMEAVAETIRLVGARRSTVLITGETGTGKEMAARALHMASPRAHFNMVCVNCSALPENLLEAELFGHVKGAFTGAANHRIGRFEQANKSTIFLDEIGEMPLELQAKLLRVLQERELQRLGSSDTIKVDVRVIAATNVDLQEKVRQGRFREDLYYRLNVVPLRMPALRVRASDIPSLVAHFVKKICFAEGIDVKRVTPEALDQLCANSWPGNVRQLENTIEMAIAMSGDRDVLYPRDFGFTRVTVVKTRFEENPQFEIPEGEHFERAVSRLELSILEKALRAAGGNKTAAAERLGMKRTTLIMKMRSLQPMTLARAC
jgi:DNA-binding NtrC family response regulator